LGLSKLHTSATFRDGAFMKGAVVVGVPLAAVRLRRVAELAAATLAVAVLVVSPASAKVAAPASGSFIVSVAKVTARPAPDGKCLITLTATFAFTGTLQGSFTAPFVILHEAACDQPAAETFVAYGTFSGAVVLADVTRTGTFDFAFAGTIDAASNARGTLVVMRGAGGLKRLRGALELAGISGVGGTYRGTLSS
jgi:hypothetical protein